MTLSDTSTNYIPNASISEYQRRLSSNDTSLLHLSLRRHNLGDNGIQHLTTGLQHNSTIKGISLWDNHISDSGAQTLSHKIKHTALQWLNLRRNCIGTKGAKALAACLGTTCHLTALNLSDNDISNEGAMELALALRSNETLKTLRLENNNIGMKGATALKEGLLGNVTLMTMELRGNDISQKIQRDIQLLTGWNQIGGLKYKRRMVLHGSCKERVLWILCLLDQLPICQDLHWIIMEMLRVRDVVDSGDPMDSDTWVCFESDVRLVNVTHGCCLRVKQGLAAPGAKLLRSH